MGNLFFLHSAKNIQLTESMAGRADPGGATALRGVLLPDNPVRRPLRSSGQNYYKQFPRAVGTVDQSGLDIRRFTGAGDKRHAAGDAFGLLCRVPFQ